jgi:dTDP-glucose 4,6-dehydratase
MRVLVTGGAGFIGSNLVRLLLHEEPDVEIVNLDKLTYAGNLENLADVADCPRYHFVHGDIAEPELVQRVFAKGFDAVVHLAAETHVDRSIEDAAPFLRTNVTGTQVLLEAARRFRVPRFLHVSTDEVYGSAPPETSFDENAPLRPSSPYSASKAGADLLVLSYVHTFGVPAVILRCTNNYGPYQFPEKLIPLIIAQALEDRPLPVYGDGKQMRDWIYVEDFCQAIRTALQAGRPGEVYNVSAGHPRTNLEVIRQILNLLGKPESLITFVQDRPGHDRRYALDSTKFRSETCWKPRWSFEEGLAKTVAWNLANRGWLDRCRSGEYRSYYQRHYVEREKMLAEWRLT